MLLQKISNRQNWYLKTYNLKLTSYAKLKKYFHTIINFDNSSVITNNGCSFIIQYKKSINFGKVCKRKAEKIDGVYCCGLHKKKVLNKSTPILISPLEKFHRLAKRYKLFGIMHKFNPISRMMEIREIKNELFFQLIEKNNNFRKGLLLSQKFQRFYLQSDRPLCQLYIVMVNLLNTPSYLDLLNNLNKLKKKLADFLGFKQTPLISLNHNDFLNKKSTSIYMWITLSDKN